jgi:hemerythrin
MALVVWSDALSVQVKSIDGQHQKLVQLVNLLHDHMVQGKANTVLGKAVSELVRYTKEHFAYEERLMAQAGYPGLVEHRRAHEALTDRVSEFERGLNEGKAFLSQGLMFFLRDWLKNHIQGVDKQYSPVLHEKGVV